jgi:uncharacterized protein YdaU (DUF1376 family)
LNYFEHHIGDYDSATAHLTMLEDGVYSRLLRVYYRTEAPLPSDVKQACRLVRAQSKPERDAVANVLDEFFELQPDGWHNRRCDEEIARFQDKQRKARASADARWNGHRTQSEGNANASADAMRTHSEGNAPRARPQSPDTKPHSEAKLPQRRRGSRLPDDWQPADESGLIRELALQPGHAVAELRKFRDFWASKPGKDGTKLDWQATWRNWLRSAAERMPRAAGSQAESFRQRDEREAADKVAFLTGRKPATNTPPQGDFIDAEVTDVTPRALG